MFVEKTEVKPAARIGIVVTRLSNENSETVNSWSRQVRTSYLQPFKQASIRPYRPIRTTILVLSSLLTAFIAIKVTEDVLGIDLAHRKPDLVANSS